MISASRLEIFGAARCFYVGGTGRYRWLSIKWSSAVVVGEDANNGKKIRTTYEKAIRFPARFCQHLQGN